jgi:DNA-binding transcriptional ArsR family regulator
MVKTDDMVFKIKADFLRALSHPVRLKIIEYLKTEEASVGKLGQELGVEQSSLSRHLGSCGSWAFWKPGRSGPVFSINCMIRTSSRSFVLSLNCYVRNSKEAKNSWKVWGSLNKPNSGTG